MHIEKDLSLFNFDVEDPLTLDLKIRKKPELFVLFINYMLGLETDSEEYNRLKTRWQQGGWLKAGYFRALSDLQEYWNKYKTAIRQLKLSGYDGVEFLIKKLIENRQRLFYLGKDLDMEIKKEEIENFKNYKKNYRQGATNEKA
jgi:hypothetical protein